MFLGSSSAGKTSLVMSTVQAVAPTVHYHLPGTKSKVAVQPFKAQSKDRSQWLPLPPPTRRVVQHSISLGVEFPNVLLVDTPGTSKLQSECLTLASHASCVVYVVDAGSRGSAALGGERIANLLAREDGPLVLVLFHQCDRPGALSTRQLARAMHLDKLPTGRLLLSRSSVRSQSPVEVANLLKKVLLCRRGPDPS